MPEMQLLLYMKICSKYRIITEILNTTATYAVAVTAAVDPAPAPDDDMMVVIMMMTVMIHIKDIYCQDKIEYFHLISSLIYNTSSDIVISYIVG
jgi:hypothetical protein